MGQKVNPIGLRLGINRTWDSRWYAKGRLYTKLLREDLKIKSFLKDKLKSEVLIYSEAQKEYRKLRSKKLQAESNVCRMRQIINELNIVPLIIPAGLYFIKRNIKIYYILILIYMNPQKWQFKNYYHWYQKVEASTGFKPYKKTENESLHQYDEILKECMDVYNFLKQYSIKH